MDERYDQVTCDGDVARGIFLTTNKMDIGYRVLSLNCHRFNDGIALCFYVLL